MHHPCWHLQIVAHADRGPPRGPTPAGSPAPAFPAGNAAAGERIPGVISMIPSRACSSRACIRAWMRKRSTRSSSASPASSSRWVSPERRATAFVSVAAGHHHRRGKRHRLPGNVLRLQGRQLRATACRQPPGGGDVHRHKAHFIPALKLAQLPEIGFDHRHRADEAPEVWGRPA